jgi:uncharacterized membrane protein YdjX (TVP38/TMEM64 family)
MPMRFAVAVLLMLGLAGAWASGLAAQLHPEEIAQSVRSAGAAGPILFVVCFAIAELVHLPALLFLLSAAVIWPLPSALAIAYVGTLVAALFVVFVARFALTELARKHLLHRLPERLRGLDERLAEGALREIIVLRFVTFMLPAAHWVVGVSKARSRDVVLGTAIGLLPGVVFTVVVGQNISEHWETWRPYVLGGACVFVAVYLMRRRRRRTSAGAITPAVLDASAPSPSGRSEAVPLVMNPPRPSAPDAGT